MTAPRPQPVTQPVMPRHPGASVSLRILARLVAQSLGWRLLLPVILSGVLSGPLWALPGPATAFCGAPSGPGQAAHDAWMACLGQERQHREILDSQQRVEQALRQQELERHQSAAWAAYFRCLATVPNPTLFCFPPAQ